MLDRITEVTPGDVAAGLMGNQEAIVGVVTRAASFVAALITILVIMVMLLIQGPRAWHSILRALVKDERIWAERIGQNFLRAVGGYVRGNLAISLVAGVSTYIVLRILGVPYAETLAVAVAILDVIPLVGAIIGAIIVTLVGFAAAGTTEGIILIIFFVVYQQFENNVLQNLVYARTVSLSPLVVFIAALIGAVLGGIVGVLLAIPLASAGWSLGSDLIALRHARHAESATTDDRVTATTAGARSTAEGRLARALRLERPPGRAQLRNVRRGIGKWKLPMVAVRVVSVRRAISAAVIITITAARPIAMGRTSRATR